MNTRIKKIRDDNDLSQDEFGKKIGSARNTIANYENGNRTPSNAVILSICREFNVNKEWLEKGIGEQYIEMSEEEELSKLIYEIIQGNDEFILDFIKTYMKLDSKSKEVIQNFFKNKKK